MAYLDDMPDDDMSDHPDHPENHHFATDEPVSNKSLNNVPCIHCGVMYQDHPKLTR